MIFSDRLARAWARHDSLLCVGLDPDPERIPARFGRGPGALMAFNRAVVDATAGLACAYKPQFAHFAALGAEAALEDAIDYIRTRQPDVCVILDGKRNDIGSTAGRYAEEAFKRYGAHAVTVNPYLGWEGIEPFVTDPAHGVFVLCRTSNASSDAIQYHGDPPLFVAIARMAVTEWNGHGNVGLVTGGTWSDDLARVRAVAPTLPLLVPGVGAQGAEVDRIIAAGATPAGTGLLVNAARAVCFPPGDWSEAAVAAAARDVRDAIRATLRRVDRPTVAS